MTYAGSIADEYDVERFGCLLFKLVLQHRKHIAHDRLSEEEAVRGCDRVRSRRCGAG